MSIPAYPFSWNSRLLKVQKHDNQQNFDYTGQLSTGCVTANPIFQVIVDGMTIFSLLKRKMPWQLINIMRRCTFLLDGKSIQTIYFSFIRPLLKYADVIWNDCAQYESNELEQIQNEAARIVTGATRLVSVNSLLLKLDGKLFLLEGTNKSLHYSSK